MKIYGLHFIEHISKELRMEPVDLIRPVIFDFLIFMLSANLDAT